MLYIFVAESTTVLANSEADSMAAGSVIGARVFGIKSLNGIATLYADWHRIYGLSSFACGDCCKSKHVVVFW
jgi:hypothetical protein